MTCMCIQFVIAIVKSEYSVQNILNKFFNFIAKVCKWKLISFAISTRTHRTNGRREEWRERKNKNSNQNEIRWRETFLHRLNRTLMVMFKNRFWGFIYGLLKLFLCTLKCGRLCVSERTSVCFFFVVLRCLFCGYRWLSIRK